MPSKPTAIGTLYATTSRRKRGSNLGEYVVGATLLVLSVAVGGSTWMQYENARAMNGYMTAMEKRADIQELRTAVAPTVARLQDILRNGGLPDTIDRNTADRDVMVLEAFIKGSRVGD